MGGFQILDRKRERSSARGDDQRVTADIAEPENRHLRGDLAELRDALGGPGDHDAARALAEQRGRQAVPAQLEAGPDLAGHAALGQRAREAPIGDVVRRHDQPLPHRSPDQLDACPLRIEVDRRERLQGFAEHLGQLRTREAGRVGTDERDHVTLPGEPDARGALRLRQPPHDSDHRCRIDRPLRSLVVQRHVAANHRNAEGPAGVAQPAHRLDELPGDVGLLGVTEVEAVGEAQWLGPDAGEVARALEYGLDRARVGIARHPPPVAVDRHRQRAGSAVAIERQHRGVGRLRPPHRARADQRVVLLEGPALAGHVGGAKQGEDRLRPRGVVG